MARVLVTKWKLVVPQNPIITNSHTNGSPGGIIRSETISETRECVDKAPRIDVMKKISPEVKRERDVEPKREKKKDRGKESRKRNHSQTVSFDEQLNYDSSKSHKSKKKKKSKDKEREREKESNHNVNDEFKIPSPPTVSPIRLVKLWDDESFYFSGNKNRHIINFTGNFTIL